MQCFPWKCVTAPFVLATDNSLLVQHWRSQQSSDMKDSMTKLPNHHKTRVLLTHYNEPLEMMFNINVLGGRGQALGILNQT
jgi:hypothetical protein